MPRRLILHIGTHKTGTTSIQDALRAASEALADHGILFPESGRLPEQAGQHMLAWAAVGAKRHRLPVPAPDVWSAFHDEVARTDASTVILSAEAFSRAQADEVPPLMQRLAAFDVEVVLYVREPLAWLRSAYRGAVMTGECRASFARYVRERAERTDYGALARRWAAVVGEDRLHVRRFEQAVRHGLLRDFEQVAGLPPGLLGPDRRSNTSCSDEAVRLVVWCNRAEHLARRLGYRPRARRTLFERVRRRLVREGPGVRALCRAARPLGLRPLFDEREAARLRNRLPTPPPTHEAAVHE